MSVPYKKIYFGDYSSQNKNLITSPYQDGGELIVFRKNNKIKHGGAIPSPPVPGAPATPPLPGADATPPLPGADATPPIPGAPPGVPNPNDMALKPPPTAAGKGIAIAKSIFNSIILLILKIANNLLKKTSYLVSDKPWKKLDELGVMTTLGIKQPDLTDDGKIPIKCNNNLESISSKNFTIEDYEKRISDTKNYIYKINNNIRNKNFNSLHEEDTMKGGNNRNELNKTINFFIGYDDNNYQMGGAGANNKKAEESNNKKDETGETRNDKADGKEEDGKKEDEKEEDEKEDEPKDEMEQDNDVPPSSSENTESSIEKAKKNHDEECEEKVNEANKEGEEEDDEENKSNKKSNMSAFLELLQDLSSHLAYSLGIFEIPNGLSSIDKLKMIYMDSTCPEDVKKELSDTFGDIKGVRNALDAIDILKRICNTSVFKKITEEELKSIYIRSLDDVDEAKKEEKEAEENSLNAGPADDESAEKLAKAKSNTKKKEIKSSIINIIGKTVVGGENFAKYLGLMQAQDLNSGFTGLLEYLKDFIIYSDGQDSQRSTVDMNADIKGLAKSNRYMYRRVLGLKSILAPNEIKIANETLMPYSIKKLLKSIYLSIEKYDVENEVISHYLDKLNGSISNIKKSIDKNDKEILKIEKIIKDLKKYIKTKERDEEILKNIKQLDKLYLENQEYFKMELEERNRIHNPERDMDDLQLGPSPCCENKIKYNKDAKVKLQSPLCDKEIPCGNDSTNEEEENEVIDPDVPCNNVPPPIPKPEGDDNKNDNNVRCPLVPVGGGKSKHKKEVSLLDFL